MLFRCIRQCCLAVSLLLAFAAAQAGLNLADPLPIGPQVRVGTLANGLTYYIQKNNRPEKRLELRLIVKAGSVLEDEDQRGLAHFTEHMAFNGSNHFKKHELISYLQSIGLKFGADLNAYTSFNETVYILPLPTDSREAVEKGFLVLEDWAQGLLFKDADIDLERAIVLEELRLGKGAQDRMDKVLLPKIFGGSQYANRLPIGTEENLNRFKFEALRRFYRDWYRPNLMAVVVVGDLEPDDAKALVDAHFGKLKNPAPERARMYPSIPARSVSEALVVRDKEATHNALQILYPVRQDPPAVTLGDYRAKIVEQLFGAMLGQRLQELTQRAAPPFVGGGSAVSNMAPGYRVFASSAVLGRQGAGAASDALIAENQRARQFGFSVDELERTKKGVLRSVEQAYVEREKTDSARYAAEYVRNYLEQEEIPGVENELAYTRELLPGITLADVNNFARNAIPEKAAKLLVYTGSDRADNNSPSELALLEAVEQAERRVVAAQEVKPVATTFMARPPKAGRIVGERKNEALGVTEWELSNGITVILKPTDFQNDQILLGASRFGGQSLYGQPDMFNAGYASQIAASMGVGEFAPIQVQKMLAGKIASLRVGLDAWTEAVSGASSKADLETLLQLLYLKFGPARKDLDLFQSFVMRSQDGAKNAVARPESVFSDALQTTLFSAHPRVWLTQRPEHFAGLDLERVDTIYRERFASAKGMVFVLVGSLDLPVVRSLVEFYLASLPTSDLRLGYADLGIRPVTGVVTRDVHVGKEPKSRVSIQFTGEARYSENEQLRLDALVEVINIKVIDVLREKLTLIYGGGMGGGLLRAPYQHYQLGLSLPCAPENVDKVIAAAWEEIQRIQEAGPDPADLAKVKQNWSIGHRRALRENSYWLGTLQSAALYATDPLKILEYEKLVAAITPDDVQKVAQRYLRRDNHVQVVLYPEKL